MPGVDAGIPEVGGVGCDDSAERAGEFTAGRGGNVEGRAGVCPVDGLAGIPVGRCGGMNGRGAPPAIDGRTVPVPPACDAGLTRGVAAPGAGVAGDAPPAFGGVVVEDVVDAAGVGACVGAVMRVDGVSVRVGRGGVDGDGVGDDTRAVIGVSGANERAALGVANDCAPSIDEIARGCVVAVESGVAGGGLLESGSPAEPCGAGGVSPSSDPCEP